MYFGIPVHTIPDLKWKELGKHVSNLIKLEENEEIIASIPVSEFAKDKTICLASEQGMIKQSSLADFQVSRYSKPITCMKLKTGDRLIAAFPVEYPEIFIATSDSYGLWFDRQDIPIVGLKTSGVKAITLKQDHVVSVNNFSTSYHDALLVMTTKGTGKRVKFSEFEKSTRARRGLLLLREIKSNPYHVMKTLTVKMKDHIGIKTSTVKMLKASDFPFMDRYSVGSQLVKEEVHDVFLVATLKKKEMDTEENNDINIEVGDIQIHEEEEKESPIVTEVPKTPAAKRVSLKEIDDRLMTIDDFLNDDD